jgi:hypothetical protein
LGIDQGDERHRVSDGRDQVLGKADDREDGSTELHPVAKLQSGAAICDHLEMALCDGAAGSNVKRPTRAARLKPITYSLTYWFCRSASTV